MRLLGATLYVSASVAVKLVVLLGINKIVALHFGPIGFATVGQLQNFLQTVFSIAGGALSSGVTKYTAEFSEAKPVRLSLWRTALFFTAASTAFVSTILLVGASGFAVWLFGHDFYSSTIICLALLLPFFSVNSLLLAILLGLGEIKLNVSSLICTNLLGFLVVYLVATQADLAKTLTAVAIYQAAGLFVTLALIGSRLRRSAVRILFRSDQAAFGRKLLGFSIAALTSAVCFPLAQIFIRDYITDILGGASAGYWDAASKASSAYLLLFTSVFAAYLLPRFSRLHSHRELRQELSIVLVFVAAGSFVISALVYIWRDALIELLYSDAFLPASNILIYQLIGDFIKVCSWIFAYLMLSKEMIMKTVAAEVASSIIFCLSAAVLIPIAGIAGAGYAYIATYAFYIVLLLVFSWPLLQGYHKKASQWPAGT